MRQVACLSNQNTSSYCYVEAATNRNPSDLYFYSLPFGFTLPNDTDLSCSSCTKNVMALFGSQVNQTTGLEKTYNAICAAMGWGEITISLGGCVHAVRFFNRASIDRFFLNLGYGWVSFLSMYRYCGYP